MILGKHINRYYLRYAPMLLLGLIALVGVDYLQLEIPALYGMVVDGMNEGFVTIDGTTHIFDMNFVLDVICMPMVRVILFIILGRFLWRICFFGSAVKLEEDMRNRMFAHAQLLSREYYQVNKICGGLLIFVGILMASGMLGRLLTWIS